ncbi:hypothetical protein BU15DRAFT_67210 [Melanogaster broomeanus]|nr:hypothetical protein BU15DRAFT_67210 [Melanogaster broomeanus]
MASFQIMLLRVPFVGENTLLFSQLPQCTAYPGKHSVLVMDNVQIHHGEEILLRPRWKNLELSGLVQCKSLTCLQSGDLQVDSLQHFQKPLQHGHEQNLGRMANLFDRDTVCFVSKTVQSSEFPERQVWGIPLAVLGWASIPSHCRQMAESRMTKSKSSLIQPFACGVSTWRVLEGRDSGVRCGCHGGAQQFARRIENNHFIPIVNILANQGASQVDVAHAHIYKHSIIDAAANIAYGGFIQQAVASVIRPVNIQLSAMNGRLNAIDGGLTNVEQHLVGLTELSYMACD